MKKKESMRKRLERGDRKTEENKKGERIKAKE